MSAQMIISQPEADQGFGLLKDIVEMVKNPKAIDEAYERRRKAAQMSDDEVTAAAAARVLIAQAAELKTNLQQRQDALAIAVAAHENTVSSHQQSVQSTTARLTEWETRLNGVTAQHTETERKLKEKQDAIDAAAAKNKADFDEWTNEYNEKMMAHTAIEASQKAEAERLITLANNLKAKAARLAAEAAKD